MIRSAPTSFGLSISTGTPVRTPGSTTTRGHVAVVPATSRAARAAPPAPSSRPRCRRRRRARSAEQAAQQHRHLVGGAARVGRDPPVRDDLVAVEQPEHGVGVADVDGEQHHRLSPRRGPGRCRGPATSGSARRPRGSRRRSRRPRGRARGSARRRTPASPGRRRCRTASAISSACHVVEQDQVAAGVEHLAQLVEAVDLDLDRQVRGTPPAPPRSAGTTPPAATTWLSLTSAASRERTGG